MLLDTDVELATYLRYGRKFIGDFCLCYTNLVESLSEEFQQVARVMVMTAGITGRSVVLARWRQYVPHLIHGSLSWRVSFEWHLDRFCRFFTVNSCDKRQTIVSGWVAWR